MATELSKIIRNYDRKTKQLKKWQEYSKGVKKLGEGKCDGTDRK